MFGKKQIMSVLLVMGLIALGLIWTAGCSKNSTGFQPILVDLQESQWTSNTNGDSGIIEVFLQGDGVEKIILDSIAMKGDKPGISPLKASSAVFQDKRIRAEFSKSEALNLLSNPTRGSKHFISIVYMVVDSADSEEVNTEVVLDEGNPTALTLEIAPAEWDLNFPTKSGDVKAFIRGEGAEKIDLTSLVMKGDNTTALPLPAQSAILQGNHVRAEFPKNQVLNLLLNPTEGSVHAIVLNFLETGGTVPIELTVQIIVTDEDEGEEPGVLSLEVDPAEWDVGVHPVSGVLAGAFLDGLVGPGWVDLIRGFAVQPVVGSAQTQALWRDDAQMVGCEALAQGATEELLHRFVGHVGQALVALLICFAGAGQPFLHLGLVGVDRHLHLVHDGAEIGMEARVQDLAKVLELEALFRGGLAQANPGDVALTDVLDARGTVDEVMDLTFEHRLKVLLHLAASHLDHDAHVHGAFCGHLVEVGPYHSDLAILDRIKVGHAQILEAATVLATELDTHVGLAHALALKGGAVGHRNGHFGDLDLDAAYL